MKLLTTAAAVLMVAAIAAPTAASAKHKRKHHWTSNHWHQRCANGFRGVDCSTVSDRDPDPRLSAQIRSDFRRGVDTPGNGR